MTEKGRKRLISVCRYGQAETKGPKGVEKGE